MSDWRENVAAKELSEERNCKRCCHYCPNGVAPPVCLKWSTIKGRVYVIGIGYSGQRNDAPFCQFFCAAAAEPARLPR